MHAEFVVCEDSSNQYEPAVGFDGTNCFFVWSDGRDYPAGIYGTRVTLSGTVLDPGGFRLLTEFDIQSEPSLSFNGSHYLVAWKYGC